MKRRERIDGSCIQRELEPDWSMETDIIVCGAGTAGVIAALTAAREGRRVLCIESGTFPGGMGTGIVMGYYNGDHLNGMCRKLDEEAIQLSERVCSPKKAWCEGIHAEAKKLVYEQAYQAAGGELWYGSMAAGVWTENGEIRGLRVLKEGNSLDIACKLVIDATSEANIARLAGLPVQMGRASDGQGQAYSAVCLVMNGQGEFEHVYRDNGFLDNGDMLKVSAEITRSFAESDGKGAYSKGPGENQLLLCGALVGKREGLHAQGAVEMTGEMLFGLAEVPQPVFTMSAPYDTHLHDAALESKLVNDYLLRGLQNRVFQAQVPYGALIAKGLGNLLLAGLSMDIAHDALPPVRLKKNVMRSGEIAGIAACAMLDAGRGPEECYEQVRQEALRRGLLRELPPQPWRERKTWDVEELKQQNDARAVYLVGKQNKGEHTGWLALRMREAQTYAEFCYAFAALVESGARGDELANKAVLDLVDSPGFSKVLTLNGNGRRTKLERNSELRAYAHRKLDGLQKEGRK